MMKKSGYMTIIRKITDMSDNVPHVWLVAGLITKI